MSRELPHMDEFEVGEPRATGAGAQRTAAYADGKRVPVSDRSGEEFIQQFCARHGVSFHDALEMIADIEENLPQSTGSTALSDLQKSVGIERILREILACENLWLAIQAMAYVLRLDDLIGHRNPSQIAIEYGRRKGGLPCHRMNVTKLVERFQENLGIPKRDGQKKPETCRKLSERRKAKLRTAA